jgi:hypothetical protein
VGLSIRYGEKSVIDVIPCEGQDLREFELNEYIAKMITPL